MRVEHIGPHQLILGDCMDVLPTLGRIDHIITDPPFSARTHEGVDSSAKKRRDNDEPTFDGACRRIEAVMREPRLDLPAPVKASQQALL